MAASEHGNHQLRRIVLPSGKTIEVVYFDHPAAAPPAKPSKKPAKPRKRRPVHRDLHVCPECDSRLVYPVQWEEADDHNWHITLRCPNCECRETGVFPQQACDAFDDELERGADALARDYKRLMAANLLEEIERFAKALDAGAILPIDF